MQTQAVPASIDTDPFEALCRRIGAKPDSAQALETLIEGIAQEVKATSNDQNVQRLARRLRAQAATLAAAVTGKDASHQV